MSEIIYTIEKSLDVSEFIEVLKNSTLAERRPVDDEQRISSMCNNANLIVTAQIRWKVDWCCALNYRFCLLYLSFRSCC